MVTLSKTAEDTLAGVTAPQSLLGLTHRLALQGHDGGAQRLQKRGGLRVPSYPLLLQMQCGLCTALCPS